MRASITFPFPLHMIWLFTLLSVHIASNHLPLIKFNDRSRENPHLIVNAWRMPPVPAPFCGLPNLYS